MGVDYRHDLIGRDTACLRYTLHLAIGGFRRDVGIETGSAGCDHFDRNLLTFQVGMIYEERIDTCLYVRQIFFIGRPFVATCRARSIVTISGMGRAAPKINIFCELLPHVSSAYDPTVQLDHIGIAFVGRSDLGEKP